MIGAAFGDAVAHTFVAPIKNMLDAGINVSLEGGWSAIETLITRKDPDGKAWGPDQSLDRATALRVATRKRGQLCPQRGQARFHRDGQTGRLGGDRSGLYDDSRGRHF